MNPYLTGAGRSVLLAALLFVAVGALAGHWVLVLLGAMLALVLGMAYQALLPAALALERRLVGVQVLSPHGLVTAGLRTGNPLALGLEIHNRTGTPLRGVQFEPHLGTGLRVLESVPGPMRLPGHTKVGCDVTLVAEESGRWFLHGFKVRIQDLLGLVAVGEYVATPTPLKFLPMTGHIRTGSVRTARSAIRDRDGLHAVRLKGSGSDLRELRDHHHGDPFRAIAWKATARTGRLMVKEYESELVLSTYVCLDMSSTMRGGRQNRWTGVSTKLEHALQLASTYADMVVSRSDRVGVITFDERVHGHLRPRAGREHLAEILHHLAGVRNVVEEDLTEYGDQELIELVSRYLLVQERLDFRRVGPVQRHKGVGQGADYWSFSREVKELDRSPFDTDRLEQWLRAVLPHEEQKFDDKTLHVGVMGSRNPDLLRRFCHLRGIEVPYRLETRLGQKERGLVMCLEEILAQSREPTMILIISDLCGIMNTELIVRGLRLVLSRRHKVAFAAPFTPDYVHHNQCPAPGRVAVLHELFTLAETDDRQTITRAIESLGIPVLPIGPEDTLAGIFRLLRRFGWR